MSNYKTKLQSNNTDLQTILDMANTLQESGIGGENLDAELTYQNILLDSIQSKLDGDVSNTTALNDIGVFSLNYYNTTIKYEFSFLKGMTFRDFIDSKMNTHHNDKCLFYDQGYIQMRYDTDNGSMFEDYFSVDGTTYVLPDDIIEEKQYVLIEWQEA